MNNKTIVFGIATLLWSATFSPLNAATIDLPLYGFQIDVLDSAPGASTSIALQMFLPVSDGFAPNINVQIQPYPDTMKDYIALSKGQFDQLNWKMVTDSQPGDDEWTVEYTGQAQGLDLHFYARAISQSGKIYLVTASAKESQWATLSDTLRKHVDSFKMD